MVGFKRSIDISCRRPFYTRTRFLFFALLLISVYSYGWHVTEIELGELVRDAHLVKPLIRDLLHPALFTFETETESTYTPFVLFCQAGSYRLVKSRKIIKVLFLLYQIIQAR